MQITYIAFFEIDLRLQEMGIHQVWAWSLNNERECSAGTWWRKSSSVATTYCTINFNRLVVQTWIEILIKALNKQYNEFDSATLFFLDIHLEKVLIFCDILSFINSFLQVFLSLDPLQYRTPSFSQIYVS